MSETGFDIPDDVPQIQLGKYRYKNKWDVTEQYKLPQWWRLPEDVRWRHTARNYRKSYDAWTAEFTFDTRKYSGQWLVDRVNADNPNAMCIDIGCGSNPYKGKIKNLIGMEPGDWGNKDVQWSIQPHMYKYFNDNVWDYAFAIGPLNHGDTNEIEEMLNTIHGCLRPGGRLIGLVKPANWAHLKVDPWRESRGLCYPWFRESIYMFADRCDFDFELEPVLDGTDLGNLDDERLKRLANIEPWENTLNGAPPVEEDVQDGDMNSQWQAVQREIERRKNTPDAPSEIIRQRWFWIWKKE